MKLICENLPKEIELTTFYSGADEIIVTSCLNKEAFVAKSNEIFPIEDEIEINFYSCYDAQNFFDWFQQKYFLTIFLESTWEANYHYTEEPTRETIRNSITEDFTITGRLYMIVFPHNNITRAYIVLELPQSDGSFEKANIRLDQIQKFGFIQEELNELYNLVYDNKEK